MKKITYIILSFTLLLVSVVYGQQDPQYTQYMYNQNVLNPAYAGSGADLSIGLLGRTQWVGIEGAPDTQTINIHSAVGGGLGIGVNLIHDEIGPINESNIGLDIAYSFPVSENGKLAFGVKGSYSFANFGLKSKIQSSGLLVDASDPMFDNDFKKKYPNVGAGVYYHSDKFYLGASVPYILKRYDYTVDSTTNGDKLVSDVSDNMHFFGTLGFVFDLSDNLKFKPSTMVKVVEGSPISLDLNASLFINELFEVGLSWREGDSIDALIGVQASPTVRIGYAYDHTLTSLGNYNSGSHELMLLFDMNFTKKHIKSPRFF